MRFLKVWVIAMGILLLVGMVMLLVRLVERNSSPSRESSSRESIARESPQGRTGLQGEGEERERAGSTILLPVGGELLSATPHGDGTALLVRSGSGEWQLLLIDSRGGLDRRLILRSDSGSRSPEN
ncbi:MAG: hypothetical protein HQL57_11215 [Magnetococcales bacterium]|nr:hypothetical protein [Magnetococcales bacterium]MBF0157744.1 hypothetical protein [Magnetococcales bacterium]